MEYTGTFTSGKPYHTQSTSFEPPKIHTTPTRNGDATYSQLESVTDEITDFTNRLRPIIKDFLLTERFPTWLPPESVDDKTRQFFQDLKIPSFNHNPSLLLHDLGRLPNPAAETLFSMSDVGHR